MGDERSARRERTGRLALVPLLLLALLPAGTARAQASLATDGNPDAAGARDGRRLGISEGIERGRAQGYLAAFLEAFETGLAEGLALESTEARRERGRAEGLTAGRSAGLEAGREAGRKAAAAAWIRQRAPRHVPPERVPEPPALQPDADCGGEAEPFELAFPSGETVTLNPDGLEDAPFALERERIEPTYPGTQELRDRARNAGVSGDDLSNWMRSYKLAFRYAYEEAFADEREALPDDIAAEYRSLGRARGRVEAQRRAGCDGMRAGFARGLSEGFGAGFRDGHREGWDEQSELHRTRAVVLFESAEIVDASGDGLLEPGEDARLEVAYVNAGAEAVNRSAGSVRSIRGLSVEQYFEGDLPPGERRSEVVELGATDPRAPAGSSIVLELRGLGGTSEVVTRRLERAASIEELTAALAPRDGGLEASIEVRVSSEGAGAPDLVLACADRSVPLRGGRAVIACPASAGDALSGLRGEVALRSIAGRTWDEVGWVATATVPELVAWVPELREPEPALAALREHLLRELEQAAENPSAYLQSGDNAVAAYGDALRRSPPSARTALDTLVTRPVVEAAGRSEASRKLKRWVRQVLDS